LTPEPATGSPTILCNTDNTTTNDNNNDDDNPGDGDDFLFQHFVCCRAALSDFVAHHFLSW